MQRRQHLAVSSHRGRIHHRDVHLPLGASTLVGAHPPPANDRFAVQDIQDAFKGLPHFAEEPGDEPSVHKYNELATLMHVSGEWQ